MGIEHSCHICACALGHIQAPPDPFYRLRIVVCPTCHTACVRSLPEPTRFARSFRRTFAAAFGLLWRLYAWAILILAAFGLSESLMDSLRGLRVSELLMHFSGLLPVPDEINAWREDNGLARLIVWAAWFIVIGAVLTIAPDHLRRWAAWAMFFAAIALGAAGWILARCVSHYITAHSLWDDGRAVIAQWRQVRPTVEYVVVGLALAPLGIPLGARIRPSIRKREAIGWINRLKKARKRRLAA